MKKFKRLTAVMIFLFLSAISFAIGDYKALLVGDDKGNVVKVENGNTVRPLASITKVMTSILVFEKIRNGELSLNDRLYISETAAAVPYGIKLVAGNTYTVRDLLKATIIRSSNNAAYALGEYLGDGDIWKFIGMMNSKAKEMGLSSLKFCSPHGLPPSYTGSCMDEGNARDLYKLAMYTLNFPEYLKISRYADDTIDDGMITLKSTNALLGKVSGVDGLKTGYHNAAGSNIILTAKRGGRRVVVIILGSQKAANRNAIGEQEINSYFNGNRETVEKMDVNIKKEPLRIVSRDELIGVINIEGKKYGLHSADDITSTEAGSIKPRLTYNISLKDRVTKNDLGKVVGTFIATGNDKKEYTGAVILKVLSE